MTVQGLQELQTVFLNIPKALIAYSGGIDSALVAKVAFDVLGNKTVALTALSPSFPSYQLEETKKIAAWIGIRQIFVDSRELDNPDYSANPTNRCYFCKSELYALCEKKAQELGFPVILNGFNLDDQADWRPGFKAQQEFTVRSPLLEAGLRKEDVRAVAKHLGLPIWNKPASPCLSSRFPYGTAITEERLKQVDAVESLLYQKGFKVFRARYFGETVKLELGAEEMQKIQEVSLKNLIEETCLKAGFKEMTIDSQGFKSGNLNQNIHPFLQGSA